MRLILTFGCGLIAGSAVWLISPLVTGRVEPWDSNRWYFISALIMMGVAAGLSLRRHFWLAMLGVYCGQAAILFTRSQAASEQAPWWAAALMLGLFTVIAIIAGLNAMVGRRLFSRKKVGAQPDRL